MRLVVFDEFQHLIEGFHTGFLKRLILIFIQEVYVKNTGCCQLRSAFDVVKVHEFKVFKLEGFVWKEFLLNALEVEDREEKTLKRDFYELRPQNRF